jgi:hypothetical protein
MLKTNAITSRRKFVVEYKGIFSTDGFLFCSVKNVKSKRMAKKVSQTSKIYQLENIKVQLHVKIY